MVSIGIDGCKQGWFFFRFDAEVATFGVTSDVARILDGLPDESCVLIDIPIGLKDRGKKERDCDVQARKVLAPRRHASVFPVPCRQALAAKSYTQAAKINRRVLDRSLSKQSWAIMPKIREVDVLLKEVPALRKHLREAHPEVCFRGLAGGPMIHSKKTRDGFTERMRILQLFEPDAERLIASAFLAYGGYDAARDDLVDAFVMALCARQAPGLTTLPPNPPTDRRGLPMEIVYLPGPGQGAGL